MTEDYVSLYINSVFSKVDFTAYLSLMFLFFGRMMPIIALVPFFGAKLLPHSVKVALTIALFAILMPQLLVEVTTPLEFNFQLLLYMVKELFIGTVLGFLMSLPFIIVQNAGSLIDHQRGGSSLMVNDPSMQNQSSPLGILFNLVFIYLFYMIDGPFRIIEIIAQSYHILPPDRFVNENIFHPDSPLFATLMRVMGHVMILSTQFAAPALIMILMADFFLGIANRLAPQVQITFLGMPLKSLLALVIVYFGWGLFNEEMIKQGYKALESLAVLINQLYPAESIPGQQ